MNTYIYLRSAIATVLILVFAQIVIAQVPRTISYQGKIQQGVSALTGNHLLHIAFYDAESGGNKVYEESHLSEILDGLFSIAIGTVTPIPETLVFDRQYYLSVSIDGGDELLPRTKLSSAPYALNSHYAELAQGLTSDAHGVVTSINELSGAVRFTGDSTTSITQTGNSISIHSNIVSSGGTSGIQSISSPDKTISITGNTGPNATIGVADSAITTAKLANGAVTTSKLANGSITTSKLADGSVTLSKLNSSGVSAGQIIKWNGTAWVLANDSTTEYLAGTGISISGKTISATGGFPSGTVLNSTLRWNGSVWTENQNLQSDANGNTIIKGSSTLGDGTGADNIVLKPGIGNITVSGFAAGVVKSSATGILSTGAVDLATDITGILSVSHGGTGVNTLPVGKLLIGDGINPVKAITLTAGSGIDITSSAGTLTITNLESNTAWKLLGNANTNPANNFIGTTDANPMIFRTNNFERMRLDPLGKIGIGTNAPTQLVEIKNGNLLLSNNATAGSLMIAAPNSGNTTSLTTTTQTNNITYILPGTIGAPNQVLAISSIQAGNTAMLGWTTVGSGNAWNLTGNSGTTPGTNFLGTTDNHALEILVKNGTTVNNSLILNPNGSIQRDSAGNSRGAYAVDLQLLRSNVVEIASGNYAFIGSGFTNTASGAYAVITGGFHNVASAQYASVGGGENNRAYQYGDVIAGGGHNLMDAGSLSGLGQESVIGGGFSNQIYGQRSSMIGGYENYIDGDNSVVAGGSTNVLHSNYSFIGGGADNWLVDPASGSQYTNLYDVIVGGQGNSSTTAYTVIGGGYKNEITGDYGVITGGANNSVSGEASIVGGGKFNSSGGVTTGVFSGFGNHTNGTNSIVAGGKNNFAANDNSAIAGGGYLRLNGSGSFGFHSGSSPTDSALITTNNTAFFGNVNLWLGNTNNTATQLRFYEAQNGGITFPGANTNFTSFKAGTQSADITYTLPITQPSANQVLSATSVSASAPYLVTLGWADVGANTAWNLSGNSGTTVGTNFLGTTDNQGLDLRVNNIIELRLNTNGSIQRDAGGNGRGTNAIDLQNASSRNQATQVASGSGSVIAGGSTNTASGVGASIGGGDHNSTSGQFATIPGGSGNTSSGSYSAVGGGNGNTASSTNSIVAGGSGNNAIAQYSTVSGGLTNRGTSNYSSVLGGKNNQADGEGSTVGGGEYNIAAGSYSAILGGYGMSLSGDRSFGFNGNGSSLSNDMSITTSGVAVFGNTDIWIANNSGTAKQVKFFEAQSSSGVFPAAATNFSSFAAGTQSVDINYILPASQPSVNQVLSATGVTGSGPYNVTLGWADAGGSGFVNYGPTSVQANLTPRTTPLFNIAYLSSAADANAAGATITSSAGAAGNLNATALTLIASATGTGLARAINATGRVNIDNLSSYDIAGNRWLWEGPSHDATVTMVGNTGNTTNTGASNVFVGSNAGHSNTSGYENVAIGADVFNTNTTGHDNVALGSLALSLNTSGIDNIGIGEVALWHNTSGTGSVAIGAGALKSSTTGTNIGIGYLSGAGLTTGQNNVVLGNYAFNNTTTGVANTVIGFTAGSTTASTVFANYTAVTLLGAYTNHTAITSTLNLFNSTAVGAFALVTADNSMVLGSINGLNSANSDTKVGIGTTAPLEKFNVENGNILLSRTGSNGPDSLRFQGTGIGISSFAAGAQGTTNINYTLPVSQPSANQVLSATGISGSGPYSVTLGWTNNGGAAWNLIGNSGTTAGTNFIGTTDDQAFEIHVYDGDATANKGSKRVVRIEPNSISANIIGGYQGNSIVSAVVGNVIAGGGRNNATNRITGNSNLSVISGGEDNEAGADANVIGGGSGNHSDGFASTIAGGYNNRATASSSSILGGEANYANQYATVGGGYRDSALGISSFIGGGGIMPGGSYSNYKRNTTLGMGSTIVGGVANYAAGDLSSILGGIANYVVNARSSIAGGGFLRLAGAGSFGFHNGSSSSDSAFVSSAGTAFFGNVNMWLGNTNNTASQLRLYEAQNGGVSFPGASTNYTSFQTGVQSADINYTLPTGIASANGNLLLSTTTGIMSWSSGLVWDNTNSRLGVNTTSPSHPIHSINTATTDEIAAVYGNSSASTSNQSIGVWGDASNTTTSNTGTIGVLATGNGNTTAGQTNIAIQVNDGEFTMGRTTEAPGSGNAVSAATGGTAYSAQGPSGVVELTLGNGNLATAAPTANTMQNFAAVTINNRYCQAGSIVLITIVGMTDDGNAPDPRDAAFIANVDNAAAGSFSVRIKMIPSATNGTNYTSNDKVKVGYVIVNASR